MPLLEIEVVLYEGELVRRHWAAEIAAAAGDIFESPPGQAWVRVRGLPRSQYAENGTELASDLGPVFVSVLKARGSEAEVLRAEVDRLSAAIARITGRPKENVHVLYLPPGAGRISFGGTLVE